MPYETLDNGLRVHWCETEDEEADFYNSLGEVKGYFHRPSASGEKTPEQEEQRE